MSFKSLFLAAALSFVASLSLGEGIPPREGWVIIETSKPYKALINDLKLAVKANGMGVVTQAGPTGAAANRGITIPGNRVIGVFNNKFAVAILKTSVAAMIEAPISMYVTENIGGTATLSYKTPSHVFAPYLDEGGDTLAGLAAELDLRFGVIAEAASK